MNFRPVHVLPYIKTGLTSPVIGASIVLHKHIPNILTCVSQTSYNKTLPPERLELPTFGFHTFHVQDQRSTAELRRLDIKSNEFKEALTL